MSEYSGDSTQLLYLRARQYASKTGRFLTKDTWAGDYNKPLSLNHWIYTAGNPINFTDPTGNDPWWDDPCFNYSNTKTCEQATPPTPIPTLVSVPLIPHNQHDTTGNLGSLNSCGPTAACSALEALGLGVFTGCIETMNNLAPISGYDSNSGIQPHNFANMIRAASPGSNVLEIQAPSAEAGIQILRSLTSSPGHQVIVDYLSNGTNGSAPNGNPSASMDDIDPWNFAHFARVVGFSGDNINLAQSIDPDIYGATLNASISDFSQAWQDPEGRARLAKFQAVDHVYNWMLIITAKGYQ
jgi:RHS repeat-associated protein